MSSNADEKKLDLRGLSAHEWHPGLSSACRRLDTFESMEVIVDQDAEPLCERLGLEQPGGFAWEVLHGGPDNWRVRITKLAESQGLGRCCGSCGGN
ncbi:MAG: DUF2249 domain-containing protein [Roseateles sp.]|uniref:DUF2249 domain-containing protein n=1 Tax=Roseateles sp. TaxID=1971397 RepID=UPI0040369FFA